jgi:hypothetical protein
MSQTLSETLEGRPTNPQQPASSLLTKCMTTPETTPRPSSPMKAQWPAGCSERPSSKAAASEEARRTLRYVEPLSDARTMLADFVNSLLARIIHEGSWRKRADAKRDGHSET